MATRKRKSPSPVATATLETSGDRITGAALRPVLETPCEETTRPVWLGLLPRLGGIEVVHLGGVAICKVTSTPVRSGSEQYVSTLQAAAGQVCHLSRRQVEGILSRVAQRVLRFPGLTRPLSIEEFLAQEETDIPSCDSALGFLAPLAEFNADEDTRPTEHPGENPAAIRAVPMILTVPNREEAEERARRRMPPFVPSPSDRPLSLFIYCVVLDSNVVPAEANRWPRPVCFPRSLAAQGLDFSAFGSADSNGSPEQ